MTKTRNTLRWIALTLTIGALGVAQASLRATDRQMVQAPRFEVDPVWPKPMPNHWILGSVIGVGVDRTAAALEPGACTILCIPRTVTVEIVYYLMEKA